MTTIIEIHVEELHLDGVPSGDRGLIVDAVSRALTGVVTRPDGVPEARIASRRIGRLGATTAPFAPGTLPEAAGASVARALSEGLRS